MLLQMRSGALSGFFLVFLLLGGVGLVMTDWGGFFSGGVAPQNVAEIEGHEVSFQNFDSEVRQFINQRNIPLEAAYQSGLVDQILIGRISQILIEKSGRDIGLLIPDYLIAERIRPIVDILASRGLSREQALTRLAEQRGTNVDGLISNYRSEYLQQIIFESLYMPPEFIPDSLVTRLVQYDGETRHIHAVYLEHDDIKQISSPDEQTLNAYYKQIQNEYIIPETRSFNLAYLTRSDIKEGLSVSEEELKEEYEASQSLYKVPEKRVITQAVLESEQKAQAVAESVKKGKKLEKAVEDITGDKQAFRKADKFEKAGLPDSLASAVFEGASAGAVVGPVETPLGYHVVQIQEIEPAYTQKFEEVKDSIESELIDQQLENTLLNIAIEMDNTLAEGTQVSEIVNRYDMATREVGPVTVTGQVPERYKSIKTGAQPLPEKFSEDSEYIMENVFEIPAAERSQVLELEDGSLAFVVVSDVMEQRPEELAEIKDEILGRWEKEQKEIRNFDRAKALLDQLEAGENIESNFSFQDIGPLSRSDKAPGNFQNQTLETVFSTDRGAHFLAPAENGFYVGTITEISLPSIESLSEDAVEEKRELFVSQNDSSLVRLYIEHLRGQYDIEINRNLLNERYGGGG